MNRPVAAPRAWMPLVLALSCAFVPACAGAPPRESQALVVLRTDAPMRLFDRLRVDVLAPGDEEPCANCTSAFTLDRPMIDAGRASFGVVVKPDTNGYRLRVTLHRSLGLAPRESSSIRTVRALPPIGRGELVVGHVVLAVADVGKSLGTSSSPLVLDPGEGEPLAEWPLAAARPCNAPRGPDEACIPGAAFWMGDPRLAIAGVIDEGGRREHLVVVDPFLLDAHEVTVGAVRASGLAARDALGQLYDPREDLGAGTVCTYRSAPSANDALPVTCVSHALAATFCASVGKRLPTEAELERAASNAGERPYVWGFDVPTCADAVFGHRDAGPCGEPTAPASPGHGARDRVSYGGVEVVDLAANVAEWAQDRWNRDDEPCFPAGVLMNPSCAADGADGPAWVARGTNFRDFQVAPAALRLLVPTGTAQESVSDQLGFRCARSTKVSP